MEFKHLSNDELTKSLFVFVEKERVLLCIIIEHVMEIQRRQSFIQSHSNLFDYLTDLFKYSHGSAQRRIDVAKLALVIPEVLEDVRSGSLNMSQLVAAKVGFRQVLCKTKQDVPVELKRKVLIAIRDKQVSESEFIIANMLNIKPKMRTKFKRQGDGSVRLESTFTKEQWLKAERARELLSHTVPSGEFTDLYEYFCDRVILQRDKTVPKPERKSAKQNGRQQTAESQKETKGHAEQQQHSQQTMRTGQNVFSINTVTKIPTGNEADLKQSESSKIPIGNDQVNASLPQGCENESPSSEKRETVVPKIPIGINDCIIPVVAPKIPAGTEPESNALEPSAIAKSPTRFRTAIKASVQRQIYQRDQCCQHQDIATGKYCGSRWQLQLDHIQPVWAGGTSEPKNLRLLCGRHNRNRYAEQSGRSCSY